MVGAGLLYLQSRPEAPVLALKETGTWPAWLSQKGPGPPVHDPEPPNPLLDQLKKMQAEMEQYRRDKPPSKQHSMPWLNALRRARPPGRAARNQPARSVKRQHASMLLSAMSRPRSRKNSESYTLAPGKTKIQCQMETEMNSEVPGVFTAQVLTHVYDTATGKNVLIPQGSTILGQYESGDLYGNERIPTWISPQRFLMAAVSTWASRR